MINKIILLLVLVVVMLGCATKSDPETVIQTNFNISFIDQNGNDLLDPMHSNAITESNTDLYYLVEGAMVKQYESHLTHPKKFFVATEETLFDRHFMRVFPNDTEHGLNAITYLKFEDGSIDTIKTQYRRPDDSSIFVTRIWYNDELRWDVNDKSLLEHPDNESVSRYFTVTRNIN